MNKTLLSAAMIAGFGIAAFAPQAAKALNTVTFNGKILNATCSITVASGAAGTGIGTVTLPDVALSALTVVGSYTPSATPFTVALSGCPTIPSGVQVGAQFYSATNADTTTGKGTLSNPVVTGNATGVDVQLLDSSSNPVTITTTAPGILVNTNVTDSSPITGTGNGATLNYTAQYYVTSITAQTAGTVSTNVNFVINYQ